MITHENARALSDALTSRKILQAEIFNGVDGDVLVLHLDDGSDVWLTAGAEGHLHHEVR